MKKETKTRIGAALLLISILFSWMGNTGGRRSDVFLREYEQTEDTLTIQIGVSGSAGYVRKCKEKRSDDDICLTFYSTYGINSRLGAEDTFLLEDMQEYNSVHFHGEDGIPRLVLIRDKETGQWRKWGEAS